MTFSVAREPTTPLGIVGKADARSEGVLHGGNRRERADGKRQAGIPEGCRRVGFPRDRSVVIEVHGLAVVRPGEAKVQGEFGRNPVIIADVEKRVVLHERTAGIARSDLDRVGHVLSERAEVRIGESAIVIGQENIRRPLARKIDSGADLVISPEVAPVVLELVSVHDPALRSIRRRPEGQKARGRREPEMSERGADLFLIGNGAEAIAAELDVEAAVAEAGFVHHTVGQGMRPAQANLLVAVGNVDGIPGSGGTEGIGVEGIALVEEVTAVEVVLGADNRIHAVDPVVFMKAVPQSARDAADFDGAGTARVIRVNPG